jgi:hypothetical protein
VRSGHRRLDPVEFFGHRKRPHAVGGKGPGGFTCVFSVSGATVNLVESNSFAEAVRLDSTCALRSLATSRRRRLHTTCRDYYLVAIVVNPPDFLGIAVNRNPRNGTGRAGRSKGGNDSVDLTALAA